MTKPLLQSELAEALGVSPAVVSRDARRGMPIDSVEAAGDWRARHLRPRVKAGQAAADPAPAPAATPSSRPARPDARPDLELDDDRISYEEARRRREAAEAQRAELQLAELRGDLVRAVDIKAALSRRVASLRESFLQMPSRVVPLLVAHPGAADMDRLLRAEILLALGQVTEGINGRA